MLRLLRQLVHNYVQYCAQCAVSKMSNPILHFQGWSSRRLMHTRQHQGYHQPRKNMSQLHDAPGPKYHILWTLHLQGWKIKQTSSLFPSALSHKLIPWPCHYSGTGVQTTLPSPVSPKSVTACPRQNLKTTITIPPTPQASKVCAHIEHILCQ